MQSPEQLINRPKFRDWRIIDAQALISGKIIKKDNEKISFSQLLNIIMTVSLSDRINRLQTSKTIEISDLARNLLSEGRNVISLSQGEPDFETADHIKNAAIAALNGGFPHYVPSAGILEVRESISKTDRCSSSGRETSRNGFANRELL